jgi:metal-responsive CopG/Arc/MetJ family transcriptional regulator
MSSKAFNITLPSELVIQMDKVAKSNFMSRSELIRHAVLKEVRAQQDNWQEVIDFTKIDKNGVDAKDILSALDTLK